MTTVDAPVVLPAPPDSSAAPAAAGGPFGAAVWRKEDQRLAAGKGRYLDDLGHHALAAAFLRSPHAHARIVDIDITDALGVDGLVAIYTYEDLDGRMAEPLPLLIPHPSLHAPRTGYPLADGVVRHVGEAVAMVVATDRYAAEDAVERIRVTWEVLPAVVGLAAARAAGATVHEDVPDNVSAHMVQEVGAAPAAIDSAPFSLELKLHVERSASTPLEGKGVYARWDADDRSLRVYSSTQTSTSLRFALAAKLAIPVDRVEVVTPDVGGGFGVKIMHPWPEEVLVPWAAIRLGREVKWVEDRREHFVSSAHERAQEHTVRVGFDADGHILGLDVRFLHDNGAYTPYGIIVPIISSTQLLGPYKLGSYRVEFHSLYTNTVIVTPYRGAGRVHGCFVMERVMDAVADHCGLDRAEVRLRNMIRPEEMPYDQGLMFQDGRPLIYDTGDFPLSLSKALDLVDWNGFAAIRDAARAQGRRVGIGLAAYVEGTGVGPYEGAHVRVEPSGRVFVATGLTTQGQGHQTTFAQIAAEALGCAASDVTVVTGDTGRFNWGAGTFASRALVTSGNAVAVAARKVRDKALRIAGELLEASPGDIELVDGAARVKGVPGRQLTLGALATVANPIRYAYGKEAAEAALRLVKPRQGAVLREDEEPGLEARGYYAPSQATFASGCHAAIVEVDIETGEVTFQKYVVQHDCGTVVNPTIVEGQIHGGVAQGIGGALYEKLAYDEHGQLLAGSFMDFLMPTAVEIPEIAIVHLETPSPLNPLGVKGVGEAGAIPVPALVAEAVDDALAPFGVRVREMPLNPVRIRELIGGVRL